MRPAKAIKDAVLYPAGTFPVDYPVFTARVADITAYAPCVVVINRGGTYPDERFSRTATVTVDAYAPPVPAPGQVDAEDLADLFRSALMDAKGHRLGDVRTTSAPALVTEAGMPLVKCTAIYAVTFSITPA